MHLVRARLLAALRLGQLHLWNVRRQASRS